MNINNDNNDTDHNTHNNHNNNTRVWHESYSSGQFLLLDLEFWQIIQDLTWSWRLLT